MASRQPIDVNGFVGEREHARGPAGQNPQSGLSRGQPPRLPTHNFPQQGPKFRPDADLAVRRQNNRQDIGSKLRMVGPPVIYNPDELPTLKRSAATLIEKAQGHNPGDPGEDIAALASQVASFRPFTIKTPRDTFEDSTSIITSDTEYAAGNEHHDEHHISLATDYNKRDPASNPNLKYVSSDHASQMRGQMIPEEEDDAYFAGQAAHVRGSRVFSLGDNWQKTVEEQKQHMLAKHQRGFAEPHADCDNYAGPIQFEQPGDVESNYYDRGYDEVDDDDDQAGPPDDWVDKGDVDNHVPVQTGTLAGQSKRMSQAGIPRGSGPEDFTKIHTGNAHSAEHAVEVAQPPNTGVQVMDNTGSNTMAPPPKPATTIRRIDKGKQVIRNTDFAVPVRSLAPPATFTEAKDTSFGSSSPSPTSEHGMALPDDSEAAADKRDLEASLDHTREQIADMSYDQLDDKPFLADPNEPPRERARNQNGVELTLEERLSKMTDKTEDQCRAMFTSMTDAENEGTGQWFIAKMQEDMEKLQVARHKRRMTSLKYEHEIKKRNATVKAKTEDVEGELQGLKNGLGSLMPSSKKDRRETTKAEKKAAKKTGL